MLKTLTSNRGPVASAQDNFWKELPMTAPTGDLGLVGRHLLLTGAGGLGRVLAAEALAQGMRVTLVDRDPVALADAPASDDLRTLVTDLSEVEALPRLLTDSIEEFGPIDAFVPSAAVIRRQHDPAEITPQDWDFQVRVNQRAVYFLTRDVAEHMRARAQGSIVLVSSAAGVTGGVAGTTVYGSTKAAVLATMHGFARIYGPAGVRINAVVPGSMDTPMLWVGQKPGSEADVAGFASLGRVGQPVEIARPILFLLSDWASYINGHSLDVDGGWLFR
jgi:NAD(P)-dependent dehydrogenase (short-subunit alcohol dehydrogenase family)